MPKKKDHPKFHHPPVGDEIRRAVNLAIRSFINSTAKEYEFPSSFVAADRAYVHEVARSSFLRSKSRGNGMNRYITVYKREGSTILQHDARFSLPNESRDAIRKLLDNYPLSMKEKQDVMPLTERDRSVAPEGPLKDGSKILGRLANGLPLIPSNNLNTDLAAHRNSLPIYAQRESIITCINENPVVIISGETGSGKTTQVAQYILEDHSKLNKKCRIICCEPRRIAAVMSAERVAKERNVKVGNDVGYQIRHECRLSHNTVLVYCTNGVLLRTLMANDSAVATVSHLIIDEIHERDKFADFLLITIRELVSKYRSIKLILMSATLDTQIFSKYFNNCPVLTVPGRLYEVQEYFLEDILKRTGFTSKEMEKTKTNSNKKQRQKQELHEWFSAMNNVSLDDNTNISNNASGSGNTMRPSVNANIPQRTDCYVENANFDKMLLVAWSGSAEDSEEALKQILYLVQTDVMYVDYQHSDLGVTPLMVAARRGCVDTVDHLLALGASLNIETSDFTAFEVARFMKHDAVADLLNAYLMYFSNENLNSVQSSYSNNDVVTAVQQLPDETTELLAVYKSTFNNEENINSDLICAIIDEIQASNKKGSVLIFLPGYDDLVTVRDRIKARVPKQRELKLHLMLLHSKLPTNEQKKVFGTFDDDVRKVILSTNVAETSITINDVVFVIDSGRVKEKFFDSVCGVTMLKSMKISQACARQRRGRAGRTQPGVCYHMFSSVEYREMQQYQTPEILRTPLHDLCLQAKLLAPPNTPITDILSKAIDPPAFPVTRNAVQLLKTIDALDAWEDLTQLGHHLVDLPVDPHLGKMLIYSVVLKCVDPVLTIVASLSYRDPFIMPDLPQSKRALSDIRKKFSANTFSDHMVLLRVYQGWLVAREKNSSKAFCKENFLNEATLEMIQVHRSQILQHLRGAGFVKNRASHVHGQVAGDMKDLNSNSENWALVKAAITGGSYPNLSRVDREGSNILRTQKEFKVLLHPTSVLRGGGSKRGNNEGVGALPTDWLVYEELSRVGNLCHVRMCTVVSPLTVAIFAGPARLAIDCLCDPDTMDAGSDSEEEEVKKTEGKLATLKLDDWIMFRSDPESAKLALALRLKWHALLMKRLRTPNKPNNPADDQIVNSIISVFNLAEVGCSLQQPTGVGARPRPFLMDSFIGEKSDCNSGRYTSASPSPTPSHGSTTDSQISGNAMATGCGRAVGSPGTKYFVIKASPNSIEPNASLKAWPFTVNTEKKLVRAFKEGCTVILVFGLQGSGHFQGYAQLLSDKTDLADSANPALDLPNSNFNPPLPIEWIKWGKIPNACTKHLLNPYNENNKVQTSRDGQEIEPNVGEKLCHLWDKATQQHQMSWINKNSSVPPQNMFHQMSNAGAGYGRPIRGPYQPHHNQYQHGNNNFSHPPPPYLNQQRKS